MSRERKMKRILVVRQENKLGDVLLTTPAFEHLKRSLPGCHITAMIQRDQQPVLRYNPYVDAMWHTEHIPPASQLLVLARQIRSGRFDAVFLMKYNSAMHTIASWLARVPIRAGNAHKYYARMLTHNLRDDPSQATTHAVEYGTRKVQLVTATWYDDLRIRLFLSPTARESAQQILTESGVRNGQYFCLHPGTGGSSHRWYPERYAEVADVLTRETGLRAVVTGTRGEQELAQVICSRLGERAVDLTGKTNLYETAAIVEGARFVLSGDTGIVHVAAAMATPCVVVHTVSEYEHLIRLFHPYKTPYRTVHPEAFCPGCTPQRCHKQGEVCLRSIEAQRVVEATYDLLRATG
ncbi:MAG: glycosyltransferase family 9 protein [Armatimonadota bacterium]|nr:glycosyltransferase family 9 protein [Armatimonadota bacterium]